MEHLIGSPITREVVFPIRNSEGSVTLQVRLFPDRCVEYSAKFDNKCRAEDQVEIQVKLAKRSDVGVSAYRELRKVTFVADGRIIGLPAKNNIAIDRRKLFEIREAEDIWLRYGTPTKKFAK